MDLLNVWRLIKHDPHSDVRIKAVGGGIQWQRTVFNYQTRFVPGVYTDFHFRLKPFFSCRGFLFELLTSVGNRKASIDFHVGESYKAQGIWSPKTKTLLKFILFHWRCQLKLFLIIFVVEFRWRKLCHKGLCLYIFARM